MRKDARALALSVAAVPFLLTACGGGSAAPVESASDTGEPAGFLTNLGVEVAIVNKGSATLEITDRNNPSDKRTMNWIFTETFSGNRSGTDDVELKIVRRDGLVTHEYELDFSNPSIGCPNASVLSLDDYRNFQTARFCSEGKDYNVVFVEDDGEITFAIKREGDTSDNKKFVVDVTKTWSRK